MQHVRIADDDIALDADRLTRIARCVAIEGVSTHAQVAGAIEFK